MTSLLKSQKARDLGQVRPRGGLRSQKGQHHGGRLSRWAYPASKGMTDMSAHSDGAETAEAKKTIDMERLMEEDGIKCFVVMAAEGPLGRRASRAFRVLAREGAECHKHLFPELCLQDD